MSKHKTVFPLLAIASLALFCFFVPQSENVADTAGINFADVAWLLTASGLVLIMTPGLSFFYGGMVNHKNIISTMLQSFICLGVVSLLWVVVGFSLAFGDSIGGFIGNPGTYFMFRNVNNAIKPEFAPTIPLLLFAMFQMKFAVITPALITGSFAERVRFSSYLIFVCLFTLFIYCPLAHSTWHPQGFLRLMGVLDFAGGTVVHISAGVAALAGAMYLGPRHKRPGKEQSHNPTHIPYVILGTGMLWFGWFGFNAGSALGANTSAITAFATTNTASAAAMLTWIFFDLWQGKRPSALGTCIGAVVGLVAITPAAGFVTIPQAIIIGFIASIVSNIAVQLRSKTELDDTLDVFPCHGIGGIVGMIATGFFAKDVGLFYGPAHTFLVQIAALIGIFIFVFGASFLLYKITDFILPLRVTPEEEAIGLDMCQHGETTL